MLLSTQSTSLGKSWTLHPLLPWVLTVSYCLSASDLDSGPWFAISVAFALALSVAWRCPSAYAQAGSVPSLALHRGNLLEGPATTLWSWGPFCFSVSHRACFVPNLIPAVSVLLPVLQLLCVTPMTQ